MTTLTLSRAQSRAIEAMKVNGGWLPAKQLKKSVSMALLNRELIHYVFDDSLKVAIYRLGKRPYQPVGLDYLLWKMGDAS